MGILFLSLIVLLGLFFYFTLGSICIDYFIEKRLIRIPTDCGIENDHDFYIAFFPLIVIYVLIKKLFKAI